MSIFKSRYMYLTWESYEETRFPDSNERVLDSYYFPLYQYHMVKGTTLSSTTKSLGILKLKKTKLYIRFQIPLKKKTYSIHTKLPVELSGSP